MTLNEIKQKTEDKFKTAISTLNNEPMAYLMLEVTGIFDYMFNMPTDGKRKGTLKRLRGRSYSCILILKAVTFYIFNKLQLTSDNILDEGGELAGILFAKKYRATVEGLLAEIKKDLVKKYDGKINLLYAINENVTEDNLYNKVGFIEELHEQLYQNELQAFTDVAELLDSTTLMIDGHVDTCKYCGRDFHGKEECGTCKQEWMIGDEIAKADYLVSAYGNNLNVGKKVVTFFDNQVAFRFCKRKVDVKDIVERFQKAKAQKIDVASINSANLHPDTLGKNVSYSSITVGNAAPLMKNGAIFDLDQLAEKATGAKYLASLKIDVDNFGKATSKSSLFQTSMLSYCIKEFFQSNLDNVIESHWGYTIYGAGDDLFVIGPWDQMIELAKRINDDFHKQEFHQLVQDSPKLTLTGGLAVLSGAVTIPSIHKLTDSAESEAKKKKNCMSVFGRLCDWKKLSELDKLIKDTLTEEDSKNTIGLNKVWKYREPFGNSLIYGLHSLTKKLESGDLTAVPKIFYLLRNHPALLQKTTGSIGLYECLLGLSLGHDGKKYYSNFHFIATYCALITRKTRKED
jgi:CRISPR-associated protein Csm1